MIWLLRERRMAALRLAALSLAAIIVSPGAGMAGDTLPALPKHPDVSAHGADAETLFEAGQFELRTGNSKQAQRIFRSLMLAFPKSAEAIKARAVVREIVARKLREAPRSGLGVPPAEDGELGAGADDPLATGWDARVSVAQRPQDDFSMAAGDRIFFEAGSAELEPKALKVLRAQARWLKANKSFGLEIVGHADEPGSTAENVIVSLKRAKAVRAGLIGLGVSPRRLKYRGAGQSQRVALCSFAACYKQNRRVVSRVQPWSPRYGFRKLSSRR